MSGLCRWVKTEIDKIENDIRERADKGDLDKAESDILDLQCVSMLFQSTKVSCFESWYLVFISRCVYVDVCRVKLEKLEKKLDKKKAVIGRIARKLLPKVKRAEKERLQRLRKSDD